MEKKYKRPDEQKGLLTSKTKGSLRRRALRLLDYEPANVDDFSTADLSGLIHELRVYQAELEIQNEELRRIQLELEESRNKYLDLYNFAPVGYFTLNASTIILDVNLAGAELLGTEKKFLIGKRFTQYIAHKNHDVFYSYRKRLLRTNTRESCELEMLKKDGVSFYSRLDSVAVFNSEGDFVHFRIAILDITEQRQSKEKLDKALDELEIRVQERTSQLLKTNEALRVEISTRVKIEDELKKSLDYISKRNRYESIMSHVTQAVHKSINLQEVLENAVEAMSEEIEGVDNVGIYLVEGEESVLRAYRGYPAWFVDRVGRIPYPKGFTWKTIIEGKPVYCADTDQDMVIGPAGRELGTKSYAAMPIRFQGNTVGVININSLRKDAFRKEELRLLEIIAQQIEVAINNAKQAEELRKSQAKYHDLFQNANDMIFTFDLAGNLTSANRVACTTLGYEWEDVSAINLRDILTPEGFRFAMDTLQKAIIRKSDLAELQPWELEVVRKDGGKLSLEVRARLIWEGDRIIGVQGIARDITERKKAAERLNNYARQLQSLSHRLMRVQETERRFLAKELHDEIGQVLTVVKIHLQALQGFGDDDSYINHLKESISVVDKALGQVRDLSLNLRPSMLDDLGLVATLRWYMNQQAQLGGFVGKFNASPENMRFEPYIETVCFRTVQEALTNVLRHANAKKVSVELRQHESTLELVIRDDGIGFDLNAVQDRIARGLSFGLLSMRERVQLVGGRIEIKTKPNKGTMIRAYFPLSFES